MKNIINLKGNIGCFYLKLTKYFYKINQFFCFSAGRNHQLLIHKNLNQYFRATSLSSIFRLVYLSNHIIV
jgi:hypothetical protein